MRITGTIAEWEQWTAVRFSDDRQDTFPGVLAPLSADRYVDLGAYWEPNIWVVHTAQP